MAEFFIAYDEFKRLAVAAFRIYTVEAPVCFP